MKHLPTDLRILDEIYNSYYDTFAAYSKQDQERRSKIYVPIDISQLSKNLSVDEDIIFGRLYYHLENKYAYKKENGFSVSFFLKINSVTDDKPLHCVNFPYLASILANLRDEKKKYRISISLSIFSLIISISALLISSFRLFSNSTV